MKKITILMAAAIFFTACKKENASPDLSKAHLSTAESSTHLTDTITAFDGTYTGTYCPVGFTGAGAPKETPVGIILSGGTFRNSSLLSDVGSGLVKVTQYGLNFSNNDAFPANTSYTNVSLGGDYSYTVKGDSLILKFLFTNVPQQNYTITYKLKKQ
jgi:hypothetical protein